MRWRVRPDEDGWTLERFLRARVPSEPVERVREAIRVRIALSWSDAVDRETRVVAGGEVALAPEPLEETPDDRPLTLLAETGDWLAVDKPAGVPVHPVRAIRINSVIERLRRTRDDPELRLAHRLDRDTSGVLLVARGCRAAGRLGRAFQRGAVRKSYLAVVRGTPAADRGEIDLPVGRHPTSEVRVRMAVGSTGRAARTTWEVLWRAGDRACLRLMPESGRRHQLRVHLEALGHPVVGDLLYGQPDRTYLDLVAGRRRRGDEFGTPPRMLLHCERLALDWPGLAFDLRSGPPLEFERSPHPL